MKDSLFYVNVISLVMFVFVVVTTLYIGNTEIAGQAFLGIFFTLLNFINSRYLCSEKLSLKNDERAEKGRLPCSLFEIILIMVYWLIPVISFIIGIIISGFFGIIAIAYVVALIKAFMEEFELDLW